MGKGRKKKPDKFKVLQGTFRADRANPEAPEADEEKLNPPAWLPAYCIDRFNDIKARIGVFGLDSSSWTEAAAMIAIRIDELEACTRIIEAEGRTYKSEVSATDMIIGLDGIPYTPVKVMVKSHPAVKQRNEAMRHLQSLLSEFGLTPASLSKVSVPGNGEEKQTDPFAQFGS
jgi:P27 family predicted phage terminase small subunit